MKAQRQGNIGRSVAKKIFNRSNTGPIGPINGLSTGTEGKITSDDKKGHTIRIIVGIIAVVVVVVVISFIAMRKRNRAPTRKQMVWQSVVQKLVRVWSQRV